MLVNLKKVLNRLLKLQLILSKGSAKLIVSIQTQLELIPEVAVVFTFHQSASKEFADNSGLGGALNTNPLPPVFVISPSAESSLTADQAQQLMSKISQIDAVEDAQIDMLWLQRLRSLTQIGQKIVLALGAALGLGVLVIIGNSINGDSQSPRRNYCG